LSNRKIATTSQPMGEPKKDLISFRRIDFIFVERRKSKVERQDRRRAKLLIVNY
jgi:hypothetical protein